MLLKQGLDFRISVLGQSFQDQPNSFEPAKAEFSDIIDSWGFRKTPQNYWKRLQESDIAVSTANHEFFGIGMIEAMTSGAFPLLPERLVYPEILHLDQHASHQCFFYDGTVSGLTGRLTELIKRTLTQSLWQTAPAIESLIQSYQWKNRGPAMDQALARLQNK